MFHTRRELRLKEQLLPKLFQVYPTIWVWSRSHASWAWNDKAPVNKLLPVRLKTATIKNKKKRKKARNKIAKLFVLHANAMMEYMYICIYIHTCVYTCIYTSIYRHQKTTINYQNAYRISKNESFFKCMPMYIYV